MSECIILLTVSQRLITTELSHMQVVPICNKRIKNKKNLWFRKKPEVFFVLMIDRCLYHECCHECEDGVELRKRTIDKGLCEDIVSL